MYSESETQATELACWPLFKRRRATTQPEANPKLQAQTLESSVNVQ
jgi:hypothetical protein